MKQFNKYYASLVAVSVLILSQSAYAANKQSAECKKLAKHLSKSAYAKKAYHKKCTVAKAGRLLPKLSLKHVKTKEQLEKERLERIRKQKAARMVKAKSKSTTSKMRVKSTQKGMRFGGRLYIGASAGQSTLKPKINSGGAGLDDSSDIGYKVNMGYMIKPYLGVEAFYADLGAAKIHTVSVPKGDVNYKAAGLSGILKKQLGSRFAVFAKGGYAKIENSVTTGISYKQVKGNNVFGGLGAEVSLGRRFSLKGEYEYFDKDIQLLSAGVNVKF
jgi:opacity protein-like surface antigen